MTRSRIKVCQGGLGRGFGVDTIFNRSGREKNIRKTFWGYAFAYVVNTAVVFFYRTVFVRILEKEYLGIEGLFTNVIQILSFAELGIGNIIAYHLYEPIQHNDIKSVAELMKLYKILYRVIACAIAFFGILFLNCLDFFIKDTSEIPGGIQIEIIYLLFLMQCVSSYFFSYRQTLLAADQRGGALAVCLCVGMLLRYVGQSVILLLTRDYTVMMIGAIVIDVLYNAIVSAVIAGLYRPVFRFPCKTPYGQLKIIVKDAGAMICHRIGGTVVNSTDNLIMSACIGLGTLGSYANYSLIIGSLKSVLGKILGNFNGSIGNAHVALSKKERYLLYRKLHFMNLWIASAASVCLYALLNDFIVWWQGDAMSLGGTAAALLVFHFYLVTARYINISYINASGLFNRDLLRPLAEAVTNLLLSVMLAENFGITGVIIGTIVSCLLTVWWREPWLLFRYEFGEPVGAYWIVYIKFAGITLVLCLSTRILVFSQIASFWQICKKGFLVFVLCNIVLAAATIREQYFLFWKKKREDVR